MAVTLYNGEHFQRSQWRYVIASWVFLWLIFITLFSSKLLWWSDVWMPTLTDVLSSILFIAMFAAYWFYVRKEIEKKVSVRAEKDALYIWNRRYQWHAVQSFSLERNQLTDELYSVVFLVNHHYKIHTIADTQENIIAFAHELKEYAQFSEDINLSGFEKLLRRLKV